ncbi:MAG: hypothetical protein HKN47_00785 [Pirellulaceae bacterium]|nr:hypothetical protein [Pirellulaceae bacterium]
MTDLAPTILQAAGLTVPKDMTGQSLIRQLTAQPSGWIDANRDHIFTGRERHVQSWPARAIRTTDFLYVRNHAPQTWDMGVGKGELPNYDFTTTPWPTTAPAFSFNCDPSPTKQWLRRHQKASPRLNRLAFGVPEPEELYDLKSDPDQLNNVAKDPIYRDQRTSLSKRLDHELDQTKDPRRRQFVPANH